MRAQESRAVLSSNIGEPLGSHICNGEALRALVIFNFYFFEDMDYEQRYLFRIKTLKNYLKLLNQQWKNKNFCKK